MQLSRSKNFFRENSVRAIQDSSLRKAMRMAIELFNEKRGVGLSSVPFDEWRDRASVIRWEALSNLHSFIDRFASEATRAGAIVNRVPDTEPARQPTFFEVGQKALNILWPILGFKQSNKVCSRISKPALMFFHDKVKNNAQGRLSKNIETE